MATLPCAQTENSLAVCGTFDEAVNPDQGQCASRRVKKDCEAPTLPVIQCDDDTYTTVYDPDATPKFSVIAKVFDGNCDPVLDEDGNQILTTVQ